MLDDGNQSRFPSFQKYLRLWNQIINQCLSPKNNMKLWQTDVSRTLLSLSLFCHLFLYLWVSEEMRLKCWAILTTNFSPFFHLHRDEQETWLESTSETYLHDWVFVAAAYHWALHWLFVLYRVVNHPHSCLLVISMLALPEEQALKTNLQKLTLKNLALLDSLVCHALVCDQCPAPRICVRHLVVDNIQ